MGQRIAMADPVIRSWLVPEVAHPIRRGPHKIPRHEWRALLQLEESHLGREIGFADYGMRDPGMPSSGWSQPVPNIRYAADDYWLVLRAKAVESDLYKDLAFNLVHSHPEWRGRSHCFGCRGFEACSRGHKGRSAEQSITFGMAHHLTHVRRQLASLGAGGAGP